MSVPDAVRPRRLRTTSSRLARSFSAALLLATFLPFLLIYLQITVVMPRRIDAYLAQQSVRMSADERAALLASLRGHDAPDLHRISVAGLFDARGDALAGNLLAPPAGLRPDGVVRPLAVRAVPDGRTERTRIVARRLPDGSVFVIGGTTWALDAMRTTLILAMLFWVLPLVGLAFGGALILVRRASGRVRDMHQTTRKIMRGALRERLRVGSGGDEMDTLAAGINDMLDEMERMMLQLRNIGNDIAHDIRGPLARMKARLDGCRARIADADARAALDDCAGDIDQGLRTVTALLRLAEIDAEERRRAFAPVNLGDLVQEIATLYRALAESQGIALEARTEPCIVMGDADLITEALANLVDNAIKFTPPGGRVRIEALGGADGAVLAVSDTGIGVPAEDRALVMQRFYRTDRSRTLPGAGLGLTLVDGIARLHRARLRIEDASPGTVVELSFIPCR